MKKLISPVVLLLSLLGARNTAFAQAGSLDPTFGNGGIVQTNFSGFTSSGAVLTANGDIVVSGSLNFPPTPVLVRYRPNGALDASFGSNGLLVLPLPTGLVLGMTIQSDGKLLLLFESTSEQNFLVRFNSDGQLDSSFASNGEVLVDFPKPTGYLFSSVNLLSLQSDGKILLTGTVTPPRRSTLPGLLVLARYLQNGAPDVTFGNGGVTEPAAPIGFPTAVSFSGSNILVGDYMGEIAEFSATGALLQTSPAMQFIVNFGQPATFLSDGELLAGATVASPELFKDSADTVVNRYNLSGLVASSTAIRLRPDAPFVSNSPTLLGVDSNGRIAVNVQTSSRTGNAGGLARLNADGTLDTHFGTQGIAITPAGVTFNVLLVQPNNDLILVGGNTLARYLGQ